MGPGGRFRPAPVGVHRGPVRGPAPAGVPAGRRRVRAGEDTHVGAVLPSAGGIRKEAPRFVVGAVPPSCEGGYTVCRALSAHTEGGSRPGAAAPRPAREIETNNISNLGLNC